ncbi:MAG: GNAT family N-acetyltransferase [Firmicutes bacterium]|nr:GNAT family N-acetyltransferase [Bacillota bacterium]
MQWPTSYGRYQVLPLAAHDIPQIVALERLVFLEPLTEDVVRAKHQSPTVCYLTVKDGDLVIAYFGFEVFDQYAHVLANVTHPDYRRQGLARFLLTFAEPLARERGARAFLGEVRYSNHPQLKVLEQIGWHRVITIPQFFGNGEDAHIVMKVLA